MSSSESLNIPAGSAASAAPVVPTGKPIKSVDLHIGAAEPGCKKRDPILVVDKVSRTFGGLTAVDVDHIEIPRGAITALIGPNGAGKTTLFNLLTGFDKPDTGKWTFDGRPVAGVPARLVNCPTDATPARTMDHTLADIAHDFVI